MHRGPRGEKRPADVIGALNDGGVVALAAVRLSRLPIITVASASIYCDASATSRMEVAALGWQ